jgi:hypothetical protein
MTRKRKRRKRSLLFVVVVVKVWLVAALGGRPDETWRTLNRTLFLPRGFPPRSKQACRDECSSLTDEAPRCRKRLFYQPW